MDKTQLNNLVQQLAQDIGKIDEFREEGGKFVFKTEAEASIIKILQLEELILKIKDDIKKGIASAGTSVDPDFKGVKGEEVDALYGFYGGRYALKDKKVKPKAFMTKVMWEKLDFTKVQDYVDKHHELPEGIIDRGKSISLRPTETGQELIKSALDTHLLEEE